MASYGHRQVNKLRTFSPVTPHFRKRVLTNTLLDDKLRIPKEFIIKYGKTISDPVIIKVPSGEEWRMDLKEYNGDVWLAKGWPEFVQHHSLENGQMLFFRYKGRSHFDVVIIGINGLEIDYPIISSTQFNESDIEECDGDDDDDDDDVSPCLKIEEKSTPPISYAGKRIKRNLEDTRTLCGSHETNLPNPVSNGDYSHISKSIKEMEVESHGEESQVPKRKQRSLSVAEIAKALSRAKDFTSPHPHCMIVIKKGNVYDRYDMALPTDFWMAYLFDRTGDVESQKKEKSGDDATLVLHERTWAVTLNVRAVGKNRRVSFLKRGWREFVNDNNLKIGDVCIFELINKNKLFFKVTIIQDGDDQNGQQSEAGNGAVNQDQPNKSPNARFKTPSSLYKDKACNMQSSMDHTAEEGSERHLQGGISVQPGNTFGNSKSQITQMPPTETNIFFKVEMRESSLQNLHLPLKFAREHFEPEAQTMKLMVGDEVWEVKTIFCSGGYIFCGGWPAFVRENNLRPGQHCKFELVRKVKNRVLFKVAISEPSTSSCSS